MVKNWYVVAGGPSSGKSTLIGQLAKLGYATYPEAANILIDQEMAKGRALEEIRADEAEFQKRILDMQLEIERNAPRDLIVFFDRGVPDGIAYYRLYGLNPDDFAKFCERGVYRKIFFCEQLPFDKTRVRIEDAQTAEKLSRYLREAYESLDYPIVSLPATSLIEDRVRIVLAEIEKIRSTA
jgi:predicted ATPase